MTKYDKIFEPSYQVYLDANNLYGWAMFQKFSVSGFELVKTFSKFNESFIKTSNENSNRGYSLEEDVEYPKILFSLHKYLPFLPEKKKIEKCNKLVCDIQDKENYVVHIRALKQALNQ